MTIFPDDPRFYLRHEYEQRHKRNPAYSWRSFARDLQLSPSMLSEFLKGRYGLSRGKADLVARSIRLDEEHKEHFIDLLEAGFHRFAGQRELARLRASERLQNSGTLIARETLENMLDWTYFALLEIIGIEKGKLGDGWLKPFRKGAACVQQAVARLKDLGLLSENETGELTPTGEVSIAGENLPDETLSRFHAQVLDLGKEALQGLESEEREMISVFASVNSEDFPEMRKELSDTLLRVLNKYATKPQADSVHCFAFQAFPIYRREAPKTRD